MKKKPSLIFLFLIIFFFQAHLACPYAEKTHAKAAREAASLLQKTDTAGLYKEVYDSGILQNITKGAEDEDFGNVEGNNRSFRHYYDPDASTPKKGVRYYEYYKVWGLIEPPQKIENVANADWKKAGTEVAEPEGGYYDNALEWARDSAGTSDIMDWEGALAVYDYDPATHQEAYIYLGRVAHLVSDMAEPDHVFNIPHPGSTFRITGTTTYGFEGLVEVRLSEIGISGSSVKRRASFDDYFNEMARTTKRKTPQVLLPMGLKYIKVSPAMFAPESIAGPLKSIIEVIASWDIALLPNIDDGDPKERAKYLTLAKKLLTCSVEMNAGVFMDFYDIVKQPPYVDEVIVTQFYDEKYHGFWTDGKETVKIKGKGRSLTTYRDFAKTTDAVKTGREAVVTVRFGPEPARIAPESVQVYLGKVQVNGSMLDEATWSGTVVPELPEGKDEEEQKIEVYARDVYNHYPRYGLPQKGYELDSKPASAARLASLKPPYAWQGYEPGWDQSYQVKVERESPPIVKNISVYSEGVYYLNSAWLPAREAKEAQLTDTGPVEKGGINIEENENAILTIAFDQEVVEDWVRVMLGPLSIPMKRIGEREFEGEITLSKLRKPGLDREFEFVITAETETNLGLDSNPRTAAYKQKEGWVNYERGPDTQHRLRVFCKEKEVVTGGPVLKGYLYRWQPEKRDKLDRLSRWLILRDDWRLCYMHGYPIDTEPLTGFNVILGTGYYKIKDKALFNKFMELTKVRTAIGRRLKEGKRNITRKELEQCSELVALKDKILSDLVFEFGSEPRWITKTDSRGEYSFSLERFPGKDGVIFVYPVVVVFPPEGVVTTYAIAEDAGPQGSEFYPVYDELIKEEVMKINSLAHAGGEQEDALLEKTKELKAAQEKLRKAEEEFGKAQEKIENLAAVIEKTWTERALQEQRKLEAEYIKFFGQASQWDDKTRKKFEGELAALPEKARKSWEEDVAKFKAETRKTLNAQKTKLDEQRKTILAVEDEINSLKEQLHKKAEQKESGINFCSAVLRDKTTGGVSIENIHSVEGKFTGWTLVGQVKPGYKSIVYLIKQVIDDDYNGGPVAHFSANGKTGFEIDLSNKYDTAKIKPPYEFRFDKPLKKHLVVYRHWKRTDPREYDWVSLGVTTMLHRRPHHVSDVKLNIDRMWLSFPLPPTVEVEGYPIKDKKAFDALWGELELLKLESEKLTRGYQETRDASLAGKMSYDTAAQKMRELENKLHEIQEKGCTNTIRMRMLNPAFSQGPHSVKFYAPPPLKKLEKPKLEKIELEPLSSRRSSP